MCEETALLVAALPLPPVPKPIVQPPLMLNRIDDGEYGAAVLMIG